MNTTLKKITSTIQLLIGTIVYVSIIMVTFGILSLIYGQRLQTLGTMFSFAYLLFVTVGICPKSTTRNSMSSNIDSMSGIEFEDFLANLLKRSGFNNVRLTEKYDLGIDLIASRNGITYGIQAKRYKGLVGANAVRQAVAAMRHYKCDKAVVITNNKFSVPAQRLAISNSCILVDGKILRKLINGDVIEF